MSPGTTDLASTCRPSLSGAASRALIALLVILLGLAGCRTAPAGRTVVASAEEADLPTTFPSPPEEATQEAAPQPDDGEPGTRPTTSSPSPSGPLPNPDATKDPSDGDDAPEAATEGAAESGSEETKEAEREAKRKKRRRILLKTVYDDKEIGAEQTPQIEAELGVYRDERLERYVQRVAIRLLRHAPPRPFDYEFKIVDQEVPNAFALPGGKIYVSRGLLALADTEDELAAVLGHEITHAAERHAAARIEHSRRLNPFSLGYQRAATIAAYGRDQERDADRGGQILAAKAGYDPAGIATFLQKLDASERYVVGWSRLPSFLATHPTSPQRSALASQRASEMEWTRQTSVAGESSETYVEQIDGLVIGEDPAGGLFQDGRFIHPDMRFSLRFPPGWETTNSPQAVSAVSPRRDAEVTLSAAGAGGELEEAIESFLEEDEEGNRVKVRERRPIKVGDREGVRIEGRSNGLQFIAAFIEHEDIIFRLMLLSANGTEPRYRGRTHAFMKSFRTLDEAGQYSLEITRVRVAYARENETLQQLSERTKNDLELVFTGVLNDLFADTKLRKGQPVKIGLKEPYFPKAREEEESSSADPSNEPLLERAPRDR